jgi:AcrR family transcriptional regulator
MNKNDLRFQKTEALIKNTYLKLKKRRSSVVKVKDLCDTAMINKTTFYAHYETIDHLHQAVCNDFVTKILSECPYIDKAKNETREFVYSILGAFFEKMPMIEKLYGDDLYILVNDVEKILMNNYLEYSANEDYALSVRFCIGGAFRLLALEKDPISVQKTVAIIERVLNG